MNVIVKTMITTAVFAAVVFVASAEESEIAKFDPRMALENAVVTNGVKWIDGKRLPLEGRVFDDVDHYYDRMPSGISTNVNCGVRGMKHHTSGMMFRFRTDSKRLSFRWVPYDRNLAMDHMPSTGVSGIDVYRFDVSRGKWLYLSTGRIRDAEVGGNLVVPWRSGEACIVNLPLYNGIRSFELGIDPEAKIEALGPRASGVDKPVVFYGTSITHGGCCSRPGLAFVNMIGRDLDVPVVGLGFSGSGVMEYELSDVIARIDASCYVLDCLWNMASDPKAENTRSVERNYEPFIRNLRAKRPDVPIVMAGRCDVFCGAVTAQEKFAKGLYEKLIAEGWKRLYFLPKNGMLGDDSEGTVDGVHPNDIGMRHMADAYGEAVRRALLEFHDF